MQPNEIVLPPGFPELDYTPFGYLDNPAHSAVANRSGIVRSVPPVGFGFWCRRFPWPYGAGAARPLNYLSFLHLSFVMAGKRFHTSEDFETAGVRLGSRYHTKTMMSYDWEHDGVAFSAKFYLANENGLVCLFEAVNPTGEEKRLTLHATSIYGFVETRWWGSDGIASTFSGDAAVAKMWAYGDEFALGADRPHAARKTTGDRAEWDRWVTQNDLSSTDGASVSLRVPTPSSTASDGSLADAMYTMLSYDLVIPPGGTERLTMALTRGVNEVWLLREHEAVLAKASETLDKQLQADRDFYRDAPALTGDWPDEWKQGWVYDLETLRMTIRPPVGIYQHPWDGMQIYTPRCVLGETALDVLSLSYADVELAKEVLYGTFADAPMPNVPCSREDGSMNMIGAGGAECGTAPTWGIPFLVMYAIYLRDGDDAWIRRLYPHLKAFLEWWLENRTDEDGWFHCNNSWESGQDGSKRFLTGEGGEAAVADYVRTVDVEAVMAHAMTVMCEFAGIAGKREDAVRWHEMAKKRVATTQAMYVDGWYRDFDARTNTPIILDDYWDVMMFMPLAVGIATPEQMKQIEPMFRQFRENPQHWLEWPSFIFPFCEAAWNAGQREFISEVLADIGDRIYARTAYRKTKPMGDTSLKLPEPYNFRIPGVSSEFWPTELPKDIQNGAECYGWGATFPNLVIRNVIGFREGPSAMDFILAPSIPLRLRETMGTFGVTNLRYGPLRFDVQCRALSADRLRVTLALTTERPVTVSITAELTRTVLTERIEQGTTTLSFECMNSEMLVVSAG